ncbi:MAG: LacI family transcriptional regulator, partial [Betaproteobacteria bacterium]
MREIEITSTTTPDVLHASDGSISMTIPIQITRRARRAHIEVPASVAHHRANPPKPLKPLQAALVRGHRWLAMLESGKYPSLRALAEHEGIDNSYVSRMINLTTLA